jgi:CBS domain-containing protein
MGTLLIKDLRPYNTIAKVPEDITIQSMAELIVKNPEIHYLCVVGDSDNLLGLISRKRLFMAIFSHHVSAGSKITELYSLLTSESAADLLIKHVFTCKESEPVDEIINQMIKRRLNAIPVLNEASKLEGLITIEMFLSKWLEKKGEIFDHHSIYHNTY